MQSSQELEKWQAFLQQETKGRHNPLPFPCDVNTLNANLGLDLGQRS